MSGQPYRYSTDPTKFRQEYLDNLALQAGNNEMNFQANKTYKATGQLPAISQMPDTRTASEILADTEKLKLSLIADLKPLMNSSDAQSVVQRIMKSPLNMDGSLLVFFSQRAPTLVKELQKSYKFGIKGDDNDVEQMVLFIEKAYNDTKSIATTTKSYFNAPIGSLKTGTISEGDLDALKQQYDQIVKKIILTATPHQLTNENYDQEILTTPEGQMMIITNIILKKFQGLSHFLKSSEYKKMTLEINDMITNNPTFLLNENGVIDAWKVIHELLDKLPRADTLSSLLSQLEKTTLNKNTDLTMQYLQKIDELLPDVNDYQREIDILSNPTENNYDDEMGQAQRKGDTSRYYQHNAYQKEGAMNRAQGNVRRAQLGYYETNADMRALDNALVVNRADQQQGYNDIRDLNQMHQASMGNLYIPRNSLNNINRITTSDMSRGTTRQNQLADTYLTARQRQITDADMDALYDAVPAGPTTGQLRLQSTLTRMENNLMQRPANPNSNALQDTQARLHLEELQQEMDTKIDRMNYLTQNIDTIDPGLVNTIRLTRDEINDLRGQIIDINAYMGQIRTIHGFGIVKRRRGRPKGSGIAHPFVDKVDKSRGIQPSKRYISFGKYLINTKKLDDDVIAIKRPSGANIVEFPSNKVSRNLSKVIKTIVGGGQPSFGEISNLTEDEKAYLYKVSRKAEIVDKISIPTPSRDQMDRDINQFEIMKGELMSGNDSKELVHKFKALLLKLSKNGSLPKNQVNEIMSDLLQMGF